MSLPYRVCTVTDPPHTLRECPTLTEAERYAVAAAERLTNPIAVQIRTLDGRWVNAAKETP